ncbi:hypothetical protein [Streptomyces sp. YS415]|uniref:hypothetical protein n=1 Tax=Streptomyces sp. YS415 TaxID=2944806 RepID=UPI0020225E38|nr:hypothetical protein [Streptomyces sp. YS415]MCL7430284.1 hypothetical protein [Streptomyces sp. YS415]
MHAQEDDGVLLGWRPQGIAQAFTPVGHEEGLERRTALPCLHQTPDSALATSLAAAGFRTKVVEPDWLLVS